MIKAYALLAAIALVGPAAAQDATIAATPAAAPASLALELNALQPAESGCRVTFLATNELGGALEQASVEMALFDREGTIDRIVTLDFKALSPGKTKVLQFQLAGLDCDNLGRVLVNDITSCTGQDLASDACLQGLVTTAKPQITFGV
jgi:hypothetical protein